LPRGAPLSHASGATPTNAAICLHLEASEFRYLGEQRAAHHRAYAPHTAQKILFCQPHRDVLNRPIEIPIHLPDLALEPADVIGHASPADAVACSSRLRSAVNMSSNWRRRVMSASS
jgi:hypothetical protein